MDPASAQAYYQQLYAQDPYGAYYGTAAQGYGPYGYAAPGPGASPRHEGAEQDPAAYMAGYPYLDPNNPYAAYGYAAYAGPTGGNPLNEFHYDYHPQDREPKSCCCCFW